MMIFNECFTVDMHEELRIMRLSRGLRFDYGAIFARCGANLGIYKQGCKKYLFIAERVVKMD